MQQFNAGNELFSNSIKVTIDDARENFRYYEPDSTWIPWTEADGVATRTLVQPLARNALVRRFKVRVGAARADFTALSNAGQVRLQGETGDSKLVVVDFGMLRTVSGVGLVGGEGAPRMQVCSLRAYKGDAFDTRDLYLEDCESKDRDDRMVRSIESNTFESRTDRVRLKIKTAADLPAIARFVWLQFPDLPTDLDLRVNAAPPAWIATGVAQPDVHGWNSHTQQDVDLTSALSAISGDPHDFSNLDATIVLSSRIPGKLTLTTIESDIAFLGRILFAEREDTTVTLTEEGNYDLTLQLPAWVKHVQEVRLVLTGSVPAERILEPVGPPIAVQAGGSGAAYDLMLDVDHAGAARLDAAQPFAELTGVRLPLRAGADGAEVRVVVHEGNTNGPLRPAAGGTSAPVDLAPAQATDGDVWTSFLLTKPMKLDARVTYWGVVVVGRGSAAWSLGRFGSPSAVVPIRRGAVTGPWYPLPNVGADASTLGARVRAVGKAPPTAPIAPLLVSVVGSDAVVPAMPTTRGASVTWVASGAVDVTNHPFLLPQGPAGAPTLTLRLTSRMTGSVKVSAVDVVATK
ncbi:MAG: hypothetical protein ACT4P7_15675 [Gemmatimonadaceae bacterium]